MKKKIARAYDHPAMNKSVVRKKKAVYPRICANHPAVTEGIYYVYNGIPDMASGQLLCEECRNGDE